MKQEFVTIQGHIKEITQILNNLTTLYDEIRVVHLVEHNLKNNYLTGIVEGRIYG